MVDASRHLELLDPAKHQATMVHVLGCGSVGSKVAVELAKLGLENFHLWDHDQVESQNIANQAFRPSHIGEPKVKALAELILEVNTGCFVKLHPTKWEGQPISGLVVCAPDQMTPRIALAEAILARACLTKWVVDIRLGVDHGIIHSINSENLEQVAKWRGAMLSDEEIPDNLSACGSPISIGATTSIAAGWATWQLIRALRGEAHPWEVVWGVREPALLVKES